MDRPQTVMLPGGTLMLRPHDQLLRPTSISAMHGADSLLSFSYNYDAAHNITAWNQSGSYQGASGNRSFSYDNIDQITSVNSVSSVVESFSYDQVGNRLAGPNIFGAPAHNARNQLLADGLRNYAHDANGSLTSIASATNNSSLAYNPEGRLSAFQISNLQSQITVNATYAYDPFNRRLMKSVTQNGTTETLYFHYADEGLVAEYDDDGNMLREYGWKPNSLWGTDPVFLRSSVSSSPNPLITFFLCDHLGTPHALIDSAGATVWSASYDTFGQATVQIGSVIANGVKQSRGGSEIENNLRFPGQYFDPESGLHYNFHRYYSPITGRYNRIDPIKDSKNWLVYTKNNSISYHDNTGRYPIPIVGPIFPPGPLPNQNFPGTDIPVNLPWSQWRGAFQNWMQDNQVYDKCKRFKNGKTQSDLSHCISNCIVTTYGGVYGLIAIPGTEILDLLGGRSSAASWADFSANAIGFKNGFVSGNANSCVKNCLKDLCCEYE